jgi:hypothetical protein
VSGIWGADHHAHPSSTGPHRRGNQLKHRAKDLLHEVDEASVSFAAIKKDVEEHSKQEREARGRTPRARSTLRCATGQPMTE